MSARKSPDYDQYCRVRHQLRRVQKAIKQLGWAPLRRPIIDGDVIRVAFLTVPTSAWGLCREWFVAVPVGLTTPEVRRLLEVRRYLEQTRKGTPTNG